MKSLPVTGRFRLSGWVRLIYIAALLSPALPGASQKGTTTLFTLMSPKQTGVSFLNKIEEDDSLNVFQYEYLYNGAGVGIGDFNNDGWNDIFFSGNTTPHKLYINNKNFTFTDISAKANVQGNGTWATGVSLADVNGDGLLDIYVCHSGKYHDPQRLSNELFVNRGSINGIPVFDEKAREYGLDLPGTQTTQAAFLDYDKDGDLDMFLLNHSNHTYNPFLNTKKIRATPDPHFGNRLFRCDRSSDGTIHFSDVTQQAGIVNNALNFGLSVTISDINKDGWPDIYTTSDYTERDCFYINNGNGTFTDLLERSVSHISKYAMGADIADFNNDGRPDIYTLDMLPEDNRRQKLLKGPDEYDQYHLLLDSGYYHQQMRNMLQLNRGMDDEGILRFSEIGQLSGVSNTDWSWAGLFADFDNDGWKDLFVTNGYLRDYTDMDFLKYTVADAQREAMKNGHVNFRTYELVKKMPSNKLSNYIFRNNQDLTFSNTTESWGLGKACISNAAAYGDLDNDGDLDLVVCNNNEPAYLYRNNRAEANALNYLKLRFEGAGANTKGYGVRVMLQTSDGLEQYQELYPVRGYQSTVAPEMIIAIPAGQQAKKVSIYWPDGALQVMENVLPGQTLFVRHADARISQEGNTAKKQRLFSDVTATARIDFIHRENDFVDFKAEVLLPYQLSKEGPALAKADVDQDGREDVFIGGAIEQPGALYLQREDGKFSPAPSQPWIADAACEDVNALFFDADNDGDMDLYIVSGGNEYDDGSPEYQDRLYINDGMAGFKKLTDALPSLTSSKKAITAGDLDNDGDMDLFIGGRGRPGAFPFASASYILRNDTQNGKVSFTDITMEMSGNLRDLGMITVAQWIDLDHDNYPELLVAGDWMGVRLFKNDRLKLTDITEAAGLKSMEGMWSALATSDIDGDGDIDFVLGNCGTNNQFKASDSEPVTLYVNDFDDNGVADPILCYYIQGKSYPMTSRDELLDQIVPLKKKYIKYRDYADETIGDIFPGSKIKSSEVYYCRQLSSGVLYNNGSMQFSFSPLPLEAQFSRVYGIDVRDYDCDGTTDILLAGNFYPYRVQLGQSDASLGLLLKGAGKGRFLPRDPAISGVYIGGDVRAMAALKDKTGNVLLVVGKNNGPVQVVKSN